MLISKQEFISQLMEKHGYDSTSANILVDDFWSCIRDNLEAGRPVSFYGYGRFDLIAHTEKRFFNPTTGQTRITPKHYVFRFSPGKRLHRAVQSFETQNQTGSTVAQQEA